MRYLIQRIFEGIAGTINRRPRLVAVLIFAVFCVGIYGMTHLYMESGWKTYMDTDSEKGITYSHFSQNFQSNPIILIIEVSDPRDPSILQYIDSLEKAICQQRNIEGTQSIVDVLKGANGVTLPSNRAEIDQIVGLLPQG